MEKFLNNLGIDSSPEGQKNGVVSDIEESRFPVKNELKNTEKILKEINDSFSEREASLTENEVISLNISLINLKEEKTKVLRKENYEKAAILRNKIESIEKRLSLN